MPATPSLYVLLILSQEDVYVGRSLNDPRRESGKIVISAMISSADPGSSCNWLRVFLTSKERSIDWFPLPAVTGGSSVGKV